MHQPLKSTALWQERRDQEVIDTEQTDERWRSRIGRVIRHRTRWITRRWKSVEGESAPLPALQIRVDAGRLESRQLLSASPLAECVASELIDADEPHPVAETPNEAQLSLEAGDVLNAVLANQPPVVNASLPLQLALEDELLNLELPEDLFVDPEGEPIRWEATLADGSPLPDWLNFNAADNALEGLPLNDHVGTETIRLRGIDSIGQVAETTFDLTVLNSNDAPEQILDLPQITLVEDSPPLFINLSTYFFDADSIHGDRLRYLAYAEDDSVVNYFVSGRFMLLWLRPDQASPTSITIGARDEFGPAETTFTVPIEVVAINDPPTLNFPTHIVSGEDLPISLGNHGILIDDPDIGTPTDQIELRLTVDDGAGSIGTGLVPDDVLPDDVTIIISPDGNTVRLLGPIDEVQIALDGLVLTPPSEFHGPIDVTLELIDFNPDGTTAFNRQGRIIIDVTEIDDPPQLVNDSFRTNASSTLLIDEPGILANDYDPDDPLLARVVQEPLRGTLLLDPNGSFRYEPDPGFFGQDRFLYGIVGNGEQIGIVEIDVVMAPPDGFYDQPTLVNSDMENPQPSEPTAETGPSVESAPDDAPDDAPSDDATPGVPHSLDPASDTHLLLRRGGDRALRLLRRDERGPVSEPVLLPLALPDVAYQEMQQPSPPPPVETGAPNLSLERPDQVASTDARSGEELPVAKAHAAEADRVRLFYELDDMRKRVLLETRQPEWGSVAAMTTSTSLTVGYYAWGVRRGYAVAGVLSSLPAWGYLDPVQLMEKCSKERDDDESLAAIIESENEKLSSKADAASGGLRS